MTAGQLLLELARRGVRAWRAGDRLHVRACRGAVPPNLLAELAARKDELLALLPEGPPPDPRGPAGDEVPGPIGRVVRLSGRAYAIGRPATSEDILAQLRRHGYALFWSDTLNGPVLVVRRISDADRYTHLRPVAVLTPEELRVLAEETPAVRELLLACKRLLSGVFLSPGEGWSAA